MSNNLKVMNKIFFVRFFSTLNSHFLSQKGYSFIELLIVFSIMGIISTIGVVSLVNFNNSQSVESAASDVANVYTIGRQRALSQIKPPACQAGQTLESYQVVLNKIESTYQVNAVCGSMSHTISKKQLPPQVTFDESSQDTISFIVPNATISAPAIVRINGFGKSKTIQIDSTGTISVQ